MEYKLKDERRTALRDGSFREICADNASEQLT
mgnify:CR=1 FL=1